MRACLALVSDACLTKSANACAADIEDRALATLYFETEEYEALQQACTGPSLCLPGQLQSAAQERQAAARQEVQQGATCA